MRIAHISTTGTFLPEYYGSNEYVLCRGLAQLGHEVSLFIADKTPKWQTLRSRKSGRRIEEYEGFTVQRFPAGPEVGIVPLVPSLFPTLMKREFDIIHAHDFYAASSFYGAVASRSKGIPFILTQHNDKLPSKAVNALLYSLNGHTLGRYIFSCARKIIALNTAIKAHLVVMSADEDKIEIIPNAVDTCLFSPKRESFLEINWGISKPVVLFVGRLVEDKGIKYLMHSFAEVVDAIPGAKLVIVGKGPQETELRKLRESLGLDNVFFLGTIESRLMPKVYAGSNVLVLPSVHEPFGNVVIEAMASGIPVIGSYVGGIKDTIAHGVTGYHFQPGNRKQLSRYLVKLLEKPSFGRKLGENARKSVLEKYSLDLLLHRIEEIYHKCAI